MTMRVLPARTEEEIARAARAGARALRAGKLVAFPTETVYGIACRASCPEALQRLRELKNRPRRPFSVHLGQPADVRRYVADPPLHARRLIAGAWPGPVTLLLPVGGALADEALQRAGLYETLCPRDEIGLRCPSAPAARALLAAAADPVVAPSANRAGQPSPRCAEDVRGALDGAIDLLLDGGPTEHGRDSTIVRCEAGRWSIVREGALDARAVRRLLRRRILFVCTGNTCRSPLAAALAKRMLADRFGCRVSELRGQGFEIASAGLLAAPGGRATSQAMQAAREWGADLSHHHTRGATEELIRRSDVVFCMTDWQVAEARRVAGRSDGAIRRLDPDGDVADPVGGGAKRYRQTARQIAAALRRHIDEGLL